MNDETTTIPAKNLRIKVERNGVVVVDLFMPAISARWIIDIMTDDIIQRVSKSGIDLEQIQTNLKNSKVLLPQSIFESNSEEKSVKVWLE